MNLNCAVHKMNKNFKVFLESELFVCEMNKYFNVYFRSYIVYNMNEYIYIVFQWVPRIWPALYMRCISI